MLVPVQGGVASLNKRTRQIHNQSAMLRNVAIPSVFIFNVGPKEHRNRIGAGRSYNIPACPAGKSHSEPVEIKSLILSEIDIADGGGNMGVISDPGMSTNTESGRMIGVANDIIGTDSTSQPLSLNTTNLEWFGVFATMNAVPTQEELDTARGKFVQMQKLIYDTGAEHVKQNHSVDSMDRKVYNEAASFLGVKQLWGDSDHSLGRCPECKEAINAEATYCKHCQQAIDPASVAGRAKKRAKMNEELAN